MSGFPGFSSKHPALRHIPSSERIQVIKQVTSGISAAAFVSDALSDFGLAVGILKICEEQDSQSHSQKDKLVACHELALGFFEIVFCSVRISCEVDTIELPKDDHSLSTQLKHVTLQQSLDISPQSLPELATSLRTLYLIRVHATLSPSLDLERHLLDLLSLFRSDDEQVAVIITKTLVTLLQDHYTLELLPQQSRLWGKLSSTINELLDHTQTTERNRQGLILWMIFLKAPLPSELVSLSSTNPLACQLRRFIGSGTPEQRKYGIAVFRGIFENQIAQHGRRDERASGTSSLKGLTWEWRFLALYETIILAKQINQVEECIPELKRVCSAEDPEESQWWLALISAAFSKDLQESIRTAVGRTLLDNSSHILLNTGNEAARFLEHAFLPWAASGPLFMNSVTTEDDDTEVCLHGEILVQFLSALLKQCQEPAMQKELVWGIFRYLDTQGMHIFSFARAFILEGLVAGLQHLQAAFVLDRNETSLVERILTLSGFQVISGEYMAFLGTQIGDMLRLGRGHSTYKNGNSPLHDAQKHMETSESIKKYSTTREIADGRDQERSAQALDNECLNSLTALVTAVKDSNYKVLTGTGLIKGCDSLAESLRDSEIDQIEVQDLVFILDALWDEVEVQEYARQALLRLPFLVLHEYTVILAVNHSQLHELTQKILTRLYSLADNRSYVFSALSQAWRDITKKRPIEAHECSIKDFLLHFIKKPPETKVEFQFEKIMSTRFAKHNRPGIFESAYGKEDKFGFACFFDLLNSLPQLPEYYSLSGDVLNEILAPWAEQKEPVHSFTAWKSSTQIQSMVILSDRYLLPLSDLEVETYLQKYNYILSIEPLPGLRFLLEWLVGRTCRPRPAKRGQILRMLQEMDTSHPKHTISIVKICSMFARLPDADEPYCLWLMTQLVVLCASAKVSIRHEAQWTFLKLWDHLEKHEMQRVCKNPAFIQLNSHFRSLEVYRNPPQARTAVEFDLIRDHTLFNLIEGMHLYFEPRETPRTTHASFGAVYAEDARKGTGETHGRQTTILPLGEPSRMTRAPITKFDENHPMLEADYGAGNVPLQTKSLLKNPDQLLEEYVQQDQALNFDGNQRRRKRLIVLASLINNPHNLGGLSRICEVLGASALYIASLKAVSSKEFLSVSVSSHRHLPIRELPMIDVAAFLGERKSEGYEIVGVEQTDSSKVLGKTAMFQQDGKTILLLGSEREGIPGGLLAICDWCVEIEQTGITRSMNVQTAAAVVMWEYCRLFETRQTAI